MTFFIFLVVFTVIMFGLAGFSKAIGDNQEFGLCLFLTVLLVIVIIGLSVTCYRTDWENEEYVYIQEIVPGEYVIQGDNEYIYRIKNPDENIVDTEVIGSSKYVEVEIEYFDDENKEPYLEKSTRYEKFDLLAKYVFYIPKTK